MKNLRITKIITALIIIIWVPSSFAGSQSLPKSKTTEIITNDFTITNGTAQVHFKYFSATRVRIKSCQDRHNCKVFWADSEEDVLKVPSTEEEKDELFRELSEGWEKKRTLTKEKNVALMLMSIRANLERVSPFDLINAMAEPVSRLMLMTAMKASFLEPASASYLINAATVEPVSGQELIVPIFTVADLSMQSDYLRNKYDISTQIDFYNYLSTLKIVKKIAYDITNVSTVRTVSTVFKAISIHARVEVEDKVVKELIKAVEEKFKEVNKEVNKSALP